MPKQYGSDNGKCWVKWGDQGTKYFFTCGNEQSRKRAEEKANTQAAAIEANRNRR